MLLSQKPILGVEPTQFCVSPIAKSLWSFRARAGWAFRHLSGEPNEVFRTRSTWAELPSPLDCLALRREDIAGPFRIGTADGVVALRTLFDIHPLVLQESLLLDRISFQWSPESFLNGHENTLDAATGKVRPLIPLQIIENASAGLSAANHWQRSPGKVCPLDDVSRISTIRRALRLRYDGECLSDRLGRNLKLTVNPRYEIGRVHDHKFSSI
jgi:hypothetical protein